MKRQTVPASQPLSILLSASGDEDFYAALDADVASGGIFFATAAPLPTGTAVRLRIALPDGGIIRADGRVRWQRTIDATADGARPGCCIAWQSQDHRSRAATSRYLDARLVACEQPLPLLATGT